MIERHPSDDEIIAKMEKSSRAQWRLVWTSLLMFALMAVILFGGVWLHLSMELLGGVAFVLLLVWLLSVFRNGRAYLPDPPEPYFDESILRKTIDIQQRRWRWMYFFYFGGLILFAAVATRNIWHPGDIAVALNAIGRFQSVIFAIELCVFTLLTVLIVCFGPVFLNPRLRRALSDELTRSQQHRAAMFGYILSVVAMCGVLTAQLYHPPWGLVALPGAIAAVVILPGIYFLILQWRAGHIDSGRDG